MSRRLLDYDPFTGITQYFHYDEATDTTILESVADVEKSLELAKTAQNHPEYSKDGIKSGWWHFAHLDPIIIEKWLVEKGVDVFNKDHEGAVWALLNHPDYQYLRMTTGHHHLKDGIGKIYNFGPTGSKVHG